MKIYLAILTLLICTSAKTQIPMRWQSQLPTSYDYNDMQMLDSNNIVAVGLMGSYIRSRDGGVSWDFVWTNTLMNLTSLDFTDTNVGYACGNGNQFYFEQGALVKTVDGGDSWNNINFPFDANFSTLDFISQDTGWIAGDSGNVFRTYNGGVSWDNVSFNAFTMSRSIVMVNSDTGFIAGDNGLIYRTFNGGNNWTACTLSTSNNINSIFFLNGRTGWLTTDFEMIYRTDNSGDTWVLQLNGGGTSTVESICFVDSLNGHALSGAFYYHTSNGGQTWYTENQTYHNNFTISFSDSMHGMITGRTGNIQKTTDGGNTWIDIAAENNFYHYNNIQFTDALTGYTVGEYGKVRKTINGGVIWNYLPTSSTFDFYDLFFLNNNLGYIVGEQGAVKKTTDGGTTFTNINTPTTKTLYSVFFLDANNGWVCGNEGVIFKTVDGGNNWSAQTLPAFTYAAYDIVFTDALTGYIGSWANRIYKTIDGGATWNEITNLPSVNSIIKLQFLNSDTGWATSDYGDIIKTVDGGVTWTIQESFCFSPASAFHFIDALNGFAGGATVNYNCKLYRTRDGGDTWENTDLPFAYSIKGLWMTDTNRVYICGEWGSILLYGDTLNPGTGIADGPRNMGNRIVAFPNPADRFIELSLPEINKKEMIFIYTSTGQLIKKISAINYRIDVSDFARGIYFLRVADKYGKFMKD